MLYCFNCKLFSRNVTNFIESCNDWKHEQVSSHEHSDTNRSAHDTMMNSILVYT